MQLTERDISKDIVKIENVMHDMEQADCPVVHRFGDGIYIREVVMLAGTLAIGHIQKFKQNNFLLQGKIAMIGDEGIKILEAPLFFVGEAGRKIGFVLEDIVWQNIWPTDETDIETLENTYMDMSDDSILKQEETNALEFIGRELDREDYLKVIEASPFTHDEVKSQVENEDDQIDMPQEWCIQVRKSNIQGDGCFASWPINGGDIVGPARLEGKRTPLGRFTNHSKTPNTKPIINDKGNIYLVASRDIMGCKGGSSGEEITADYRDMLKLSGVEL